MVIQRSANRFLRAFDSAYAIKDPWGVIGKKFNNLASAKKWGLRMSAREGFTLSIWSGKGFTVSLGIKYRGGRRVQ